MADSKSRTVAHAADSAPPPHATSPREPMLPEIEVEGSNPALDAQPAAPVDAGAAAPQPPPDAHDPLAPLKSLSEAELIALFS